MLTCGIDTQGERLELCVIGWGETGQPFILSHRIFMGRRSRTRFGRISMRFLKPNSCIHPGLSCRSRPSRSIPAAPAAGRNGFMPSPARRRTGEFTRSKAFLAAPQIARCGNAASRKTRKTAHLHLIKVDEVKDEVFDRLAALPYLDTDGEPTIERTGTRNNIAFRLTNSLGGEFLEQLTNERIYKSYGVGPARNP